MARSAQLVVVGIIAVVNATDIGLTAIETLNVAIIRAVFITASVKLVVFAFGIVGVMTMIEYEIIVVACLSVS